MAVYTFGHVDGPLRPFRHAGVCAISAGCSLSGWVTWFPGGAVIGISGTVIAEPDDVDMAISTPGRARSATSCQHCFFRRSQDTSALLATGQRLTETRRSTTSRATHTASRLATMAIPAPGKTPSLSPSVVSISAIAMEARSPRAILKRSKPTEIAFQQLAENGELFYCGSQ